MGEGGDEGDEGEEEEVEMEVQLELGERLCWNQ